MEKVCNKCKTSKDENDFNKSKHEKDGLQKYCKSCRKELDFNSEYSKRRTNKIISLRERKRELTNEIKIERGGECEKCGDKRLYVLDFHHLDPKIKISGISEMLRNLFIDKKLVIQESKKCILLCANCHREFHYLENN